MANTFTYLDECLKNGLTVRWPDGMMPLKIYIAPFTWYEQSKQHQSEGYRQMVTSSLDTWVQATKGRFTYQLVSNLHDSNIDISWRRVDRKSLGHCQYIFNKEMMLYSAEVSIGVSDGIMHARYNDPTEVHHTILHEIGHALGLIGHSRGPGDIMYVPHQYGVAALSERDKTTIEWLYRLPGAFDFQQKGTELKLPQPFNIHNVIDVLSGRKKEPQKEKNNTQPAKPPEELGVVLDAHHDILTHMGKFHMATQNIQWKGTSSAQKQEKSTPKNKPEDTTKS